MIILLLPEGYWVTWTVLNIYESYNNSELQAEVKRLNQQSRQLQTRVKKQRALQAKALEAQKEVQELERKNCKLTKRIW